ncbi:metallophosphoesterase [Sporosarcina aquimarina]|uniref:Metallophosphoesterase n=1 Tax=Sporosarcina aquimarina TaxID=114975 RepID=A0ABU4FWM2_9BACL|nr:metallophosphoesterase [Sporosarcina aquimarina]MDW0109100.1 metallophosphoesterase [Sporosarcina aquimarina]
MKVLWIGLYTLLAFSCALFMSMFCSAHRNSVKLLRMQTNSNHLSNAELTVFFISDIHRRKVSSKLLKKVKEQNKFIDLVIIGGDLAEKGVPSSRVRSNVRQLASLGPVYYIWGNNDREIGETTIRDLISEVNGEILANKSTLIPKHPDWILSGADDPSSGNTNLQKALSYDGEYTYHLLAVHSPSLFDKAAKIADPDFMVAGHTHGGQIRLGPFGMQPRGTFVEKGGRGRLISNGFGTSLIPLRLGAPPETHLITINYEKKKGKGKHD